MVKNGRCIFFGLPMGVFAIAIPVVIIPEDRPKVVSVSQHSGPKHWSPLNIANLDGTVVFPV